MLMADLASHRDDFPALDGFTWFNNGVVSLTPRLVNDEYVGRIQEILERGPMHVTFPEEEYPRRRASHERIAGFLGARTEDVALMRGVSEAYQTVLRGIDWRPGDQLITSSDEEAALFLASMHLRDTAGVDVVRLPVELEPAELVRAMEARLSNRTRLLALSHVTTNLGFRLPVAELCRSARERGVLSFVDLAHSVGLFPIDLPEIGCDFAGALSYKWMYGPYAAGVLWVRSGSVSQIALRYAGNRSETFLDEENATYGLKATADRFEYGPWTWPVVHAWAAAADYIDRLGLAAIWERTSCLTSMLKDELGSIPGVAVLTPSEPDRSAALVTFTIAGVSGEAASRTLRSEFNVRMKHVPSLPNGLRASVAFFNLESEVEHLVRCVGELAHRAARSQ